jgi:hypothetical protein
LSVWKVVLRSSTKALMNNHVGETGSEREVRALKRKKRAWQFIDSAIRLRLVHSKKTHHEA